MSSRSQWFFCYRYGKFLTPVWCVNFSCLTKRRNKPGTFLLQQRPWCWSLLALKQFQVWSNARLLASPARSHLLSFHFGKWVELWFLGYPMEVFPMPVLCSSCAMEIAMIISRNFWKKIFHLLFWCKIQFPVFIYSSSHNWGLRSALSEWKPECSTHFKQCSRSHTETGFSFLRFLDYLQQMIHIYSRRWFERTKA